MGNNFSIKSVADFEQLPQRLRLQLVANLHTRIAIERRTSGLNVPIIFWYHKTVPDLDLGDAIHWLCSNINFDLYPTFMEPLRDHLEELGRNVNGREREPDRLRVLDDGDSPRLAKLLASIDANRLQACASVKELGEFSPTDTNEGRLYKALAIETYLEHVNWGTQFKVVDKTTIMARGRNWMVNLSADSKLEAIQKHYGICTRCLMQMDHDISEPFASCACGTAEYTTVPKSMRAAHQFRTYGTLPEPETIRYQYDSDLVAGWAAAYPAGKDLWFDKNEFFPVQRMCTVYMLPTIVCAATRFDGEHGSTIAVQIRHGGGINSRMSMMVRPYSGGEVAGTRRGVQGFVDQYGNFYGRELAFIVYEANGGFAEAGQRERNSESYDKRLYSEGLYPRHDAPDYNSLSKK